MLLFYNLSIWCYFFIIKIASLFQDKAKLWLDGRKEVFSLLEKALANNNSSVIWMHCASLGEFEQGRPVLEQLRNEYPDHFLLLTFFSPSGYEIRKQYSEVDYVSYLPLDTANNAKRFLELVQPKLAIFVKYEFWYHYLTILRQKSVPTVLISAIFRKEQHFFKLWGGLFREMLHCFHHVFVQDKVSEKLLNNIGMGEWMGKERSNVTRCGDTRVDQVLQIAKTNQLFPEIETFVLNHKVMVCGSTWNKDEEIIAEWFQKATTDWKLIVAPHDIQEQRLQDLEQRFDGQTIRSSRLNNNTSTGKRVLIIDNIGMLSSLYRYAYTAYVGGGFGRGIHNILEPAAYGIPILFGPKFWKFREAQILVEQKGAFVVGDLRALVRNLVKEGEYADSSRIVSQFMRENEGATKVVMDFLSRLLEPES